MPLTLKFCKWLPLQLSEVLEATLIYTFLTFLNTTKIARVPASWRRSWGKISSFCDQADVKGGRVRPSSWKSIRKYPWNIRSVCVTLRSQVWSVLRAGHRCGLCHKCGLCYALVTGVVCVTRWSQVWSVTAGVALEQETKNRHVDLYQRSQIRAQH